MLETMPKLTPVKTKSRQRVYFQSFCPISHNPKEGSYIEFEYQTEKEGDVFLEVYSLQQFVLSFDQGKYITCPYSGKVFVRDMEQLIEQIHATVSDILSVNASPSVYTYAYLILDCGEMFLEIGEKN